MNIYLSQIYLLALDNKYTKWYIKLCSSRYNRTRTKKEANILLGYTEAHHILPESFELGGENDPINKVHFTPREHFVAHWLLSKMFKEPRKFWHQMGKAFKSMSTNKNRRKLKSWQYTILKHERHNLWHTEETKKKIGDGNRGKPRTESQRKYLRDMWTGTKRSEEDKLKISIGQTGRVWSEESKKKASISQTGKKRTPEQRQKLSDIRTGVKRGPHSDSHKLAMKNAYVDQRTIRATCTKCGKEGPKFIINRDHNEKCKAYC